MKPGSAFLQAPVWYEPLRKPTWLLPAARDSRVHMLLAPESWPDDAGPDEDGRDLRLGLPLFLAEAVHYLTDVVPAVRTSTMEPSTDPQDPRLLLLTSVSPGGRGTIRIRVLDPDFGGERAPIEVAVDDEAQLGRALTSLPRAVVDVLRGYGATTSWDPRYVPPPAALAARIVRGHHACLRLTDPARFSAQDVDGRATTREQTRAVLQRLADAATSTGEAMPAVLFFAALLGATSAGFDSINDFRLPVNARCMEASDPRDPVFRLSVLVLRTIGDTLIAERRAGQLQAVADPELHRWLARVRSV